MAKIIGVEEGLRAGSIATRIAPQRRQIVEHVSQPDQPTTCSACDGHFPSLQVGRSKSSYYTPEEYDGLCRFCCEVFGEGPYNEVMGRLGPVHGLTSYQPAQARLAMTRLREDGYGMILRYGTFGDSNGTIEVEPGDIFKIHRAGLLVQHDREVCTRERSMEMFSIEIMLGPIALKLWPHEISGMSFMRIMELKQAGEIEESYVAQEDESGYFKPTGTLREEIYAVFGRLTGRPDAGHKPHRSKRKSRKPMKLVLQPGRKISD